MPDKDIFELREEFDAELEEYGSHDIYRSAIERMLEENPANHEPYAKKYFMDADIDPNGVFDLLGKGLKACGEHHLLRHLMGMILLHYSELMEKTADVKEQLGASPYATRFERALSRKGERAMEEFRKALELNPESYETILSIAHSLDARSRYMEARRYWKKAIGMRPSDPQVWLGLSSSESAAGNHRPALEYLDKALSLLNEGTHKYIKNAMGGPFETYSSTRAYFLSIRSLLKLQLNDIDSARGDADEAAALNPEIGLKAMNAVINRMGSEGMHQESGKTMKKTIDMMVDNGEKADYLKDLADASVLSSEGDEDKMLEFAKRMADKDDTGEYVRKMRDAAFEAGDIKMGAALYVSLVLKRKKEGIEPGEDDDKLLINLRVPKKAKLEPFLRNENKIKRNAPCPCGSGEKYKKCCGGH